MSIGRFFKIKRVKNLDKNEKRILGYCWYEVQ